jgi:16S rRNA processing protein RimM
MSLTPPDSTAEDFVEVGHIMGTVGKFGELRVEELTDLPRRFAPDSTVYLNGKPVRVRTSRQGRGGLIIEIEGIDTPEAARALHGATLEVPVSELPQLPEGTFYHYHLIGLRVASTEGEELGTLAEIIATGANDVYVVKGPGADLLLPAIPDVIKKVDVDKGEMTVELVPGLR